jgi:hypothetical protein
MLPIVLDKASRNKLLAQRAESARGESVPLRWFGLLDEISREETGIGAADLDWVSAVSGQGRLFVSNASNEALVTALSSRSLVYLCWGIPQRGWKGQVIITLLRRARHVLANDRTTGREIEELAGRATEIVPYFIDTGFFTYRPLDGRGDFLFCNGTNDRDGDVVLGLALQGFRVVWLVSDPAQRARYEGKSPNLELRSHISYAELREFNQTCAAAIMPIVADRHCAGQTTGLEAIACGAPLLVTAGRTASIFAGLSSVVAVTGNDPAVWGRAVAGMLADDGLADTLMISRQVVEHRLSRDVIRRSLAPFFGWNVLSGERSTIAWPQ